MAPALARGCAITRAERTEIRERLYLTFFKLDITNAHASLGDVFLNSFFPVSKGTSLKEL